MQTGPGNQWRTLHMHRRLLPNSTMTTQMQCTNTEGPKEKSCVLNYLKPVLINFHLFVPTTPISLAWYNLRHGCVADPLSVCTHLTIALLALLMHSLTLTIVMGHFMTHLATHPLWHALVWTLLLVGWTITIILLDWGLRWYFITSVLSCI